MYGKIFESMYDGTLADEWQALITFQQMIVLGGADGVVDMTPKALSRRTGIPIEHVEAGIAVLEAPDENSRSPDRQGARIERLDAHRPWGWSIVNHRKYRDMATRAEKREADRKRIAEKRAAEKSETVDGCSGVSQGVAGCRKVSPTAADVAHADAYADIKTTTTTRESESPEPEEPEQPDGDPKDSIPANSLPFADGYFEPTEDDLTRWQGYCPDIDVRKHLLMIAMWLDSHPKERAKKSLMMAKQFVTTWLKTEQQKAMERDNAKPKQPSKGSGEIDWDSDFDLDPFKELRESGQENGDDDRDAIEGNCSGVETSSVER